MSTRKHVITGEVREISDEQIAAWTAAGNPKAGMWEEYANPPAPEVPVVVIPQEITNRQFRLALRRVTGIAPSAVTNTLTGIQDSATREDALSEWEYGNTIRRDSDLLLTFAAQFGVTAAQLDSIFTLGNSIT